MPKSKLAKHHQREGPMGNTSSQPAPPDPDVFGAQSQLKPDHEDDIAASSQLASEAHGPQPDKPKKKDRKSKKEKRRSRELQNVAEADVTNHDLPLAVTANEESNQAPVPTPDASQDRGSHKKKTRKHKSPSDEVAQEALQTDGAAEPAADAYTESGTAHDVTSKKRKRKSKDESLDAQTQPRAAAVAAPVPIEEELDPEERSSKKHRKSKRDSSGAGKVSSTPIPLSDVAALVPVPTEATPISADAVTSSQPTDASQTKASKKHKRKADVPVSEAAKKEMAPTVQPQLTQEILGASSEAHQTEEVSRKNQKRKKKSRHSDVTEDEATGHNQPSPEQIRVELTGMPEILQEPRAEAQESNATEEAQAIKKHKKKKRLRAETSATQEDASAGAQLPANDSAPIDPAIVNGNDQLAEVAQDGAAETQKKRKRPVTTEPAELSQAAAAPPTQPENASQPKPKKQKTKKKGEEEPLPSEDFPTLGPFTDKELERVDAAVASYRDFHNLTQERVNELIQNVSGMDESVRTLWDELTGALPNRKRQSVYRLARRRYHNFHKRGSWTPEEDEELRQVYQLMPNRWKEIGARIGRMPDDIRDRWRNYLQCGEAKVTEAWDDQEISKLLNAVHECCDALLQQLPEEHQRYWRKELQCETVGKPFWKNAEIRDFINTLPDFLGAMRENVEHRAPTAHWSKPRKDENGNAVDEGGNVIIDWNVVSEKMGHRRSRLQCLMKFKGLERQFAKPQREENPNSWRLKNGVIVYNKLLPGDKYATIKTLMALGAQDEERIHWAKVDTNDLDTDWKPHVRKVALQEMKKLVPPQDSLPDLLRALKRYFEVNHPNELRDFYVEPPRAPKPPPESKGRYKLSAAKISEEDDMDEDGDVGTGDQGAQGASAQGNVRNVEDDIDSVLDVTDDNSEESDE